MEETTHWPHFRGPHLKAVERKRFEEHHTASVEEAAVRHNRYSTFHQFSVKTGPVIGLVLTFKTGRSPQVTVSLTDGGYFFLTMKCMILERLNTNRYWCRRSCPMSWELFNSKDLVNKRKHKEIPFFFEYFEYISILVFMPPLV